MKRDEIKSILSEDNNLQKLLFPKGFLMTNDKSLETETHPFYGRWHCIDVFTYRFFVHHRQTVYTKTDGKIGMVLIGHAFDPVDSEPEICENRILEKAINCYQRSEESFIEYFNQWTGLFALFLLHESGIRVYGDPAGMYTVFYGVHEGNVYCGSHTNLLGDVCGLEFDEYVSRLIRYRLYHLFGKALPGDVTPYPEFRRLIPNHFAEYKDKDWQATRFFPTENNSLYSVPYDELIDTAAGILSQSMKMIHRKWNRAAISLTGGCDSKTTLACTSGVYEKYRYFSYISSEREAVDAHAAEKICEILEIPHKIYTVSDCCTAGEFEKIAKVMEYNSGSIGKNNENDVRKRAFFLNTDDFDVEVKSWVSEIARAYYHKRFAKRSFPQKLTPQYARTLYKVFLTDRKLIRETDEIFAAFLQKYYSDGSFERIPWYDLFFWEFRMSSWNGLVITGEQQIAYDITIPYNNRILLQLLLSTPVEKRIKDEPHWDIMRKMNPRVADCGISVVNVKHTKKRAKAEAMYLLLTSKWEP